MTILEVAHEAVVPAWVSGAFVLVLLLSALQILRNLGKSRPHS